MVSTEEVPEEELRASQTTPLESLSERLTFPEVEAQVTGLNELYNTVANSKLLFSDIRHGLTFLAEEREQTESGLVSKWRQKDRLKTTAVALVVCLNIGVDPPDVIKISPCARIECWMDPLSVQAPKALESIGKNLQAQYERWQPRAKYKMELDPTSEDVKKVVSSCRRSAKSERVLFHYNGHGVPRPTANGEIWVFNKSYTQYIPLSIYDLQSWIGNPAIYIFDCSIAGQILSSFKQFFTPSRDKWGETSDKASLGNFRDPMQDMILMCACSENELLPQDATFPADIFTSCLTTPIKIALHWFCSRSLLGNEGITKDIIDRIPGKQTDRKTPLGELNWIFTAITDTIAWNALPRSLFQKLFRQDLLVASLFRNFLLAQRIMRSVGCTPVSHPRLPIMDQHPMWLAWDMAAETCLLQLPDILDDSAGQKDYTPSPFFSEQLTAFELWLDHGSVDKAPPEQLPIVLQVLLSQVHRLRALVLLGRFIDMGSWAVDLALSVGIFPYILKLLQTSAADLRQTLVFIWSKIVSWDMNPQVQNDLTKDGGYLYFIKHLEAEDSDIVPESRAQAAFVLSAICKKNRKGQLLCAQAGLLQICRAQIPATFTAMKNPSQIGSDRKEQLEMLLKWLIICAGQVCEDVPEAVGLALDCQLQESFVDLLDSDSPNIRAAAIYATGSLFISENDPDNTTESPDYERMTIYRLLEGIYDASPLVRSETVRSLYRVLISKFHWVSEHIATILEEQKEQGLSKSAPSWSQLRNQTPDMHSLKMSSSQEALTGTGTVQVEQLENLSEAQDSQGIVRILLDSIIILVKDPSRNVRVQASRALLNLGFDVSGRNLSSSKSTATDTSNPTLIKPNISGGMSSFLPKSWQAKSWRSFSSPVSKQVANDQVPRHSQEQERSLPDRHHQSPDSSISQREHIVSAVNFIGHQHIKWPLLSPLAEEEPGIAWLKACPPNKLKMREQMKAGGISRCRKSTKVRLREQVHAINTNGAAVEAIFLEPFKTQLVTADARGKIRVFDYLQSRMVNEFDSNKESAIVSPVSAMYRLNDLYNELLLSCSRNGTVVAWRYYNKPGCELPATSWQAVSHEGIQQQPAIYSFSEQYLGGSLFAATYKSSTGENSINVWDLHREYCVDEILSAAKTVKKYRQMEASKIGSLLYALSDEGDIELFDLRSSSLISRHSIGKDAVGMIPELPGSESYVISGHLSGRINFFDNRMNTSSSCLTLEQNVDGHSKGTMTVICPHKNAPIFATATCSQVVKVWSAKGDQLGVVRAHASILGQPIGPTKCLAFSPISLKLASGAEDAVCAVYSLEQTSNA